MPRPTLPPCWPPGGRPPGPCRRPAYAAALLSASPVGPQSEIHKTSEQVRKARTNQTALLRHDRFGGTSVHLPARQEAEQHFYAQRQRFQLTRQLIRAFALLASPGLRQVALSGYSTKELAPIAVTYSLRTSLHVTVQVELFSGALFGTPPFAVEREKVKGKIVPRNAGLKLCPFSFCLVAVPMRAGLKLCPFAFFLSPVAFTRPRPGRTSGYSVEQQQRASRRFVRTLRGLP